MRDHDTRPARTRSAKETAKIAVGAVLLVLLVLFVSANTDKTRISFLVTDVDLPLIVVLIGTAVLGGAITEAFRYARSRR